MLRHITARRRVMEISRISYLAFIFAGLLFALMNTDASASAISAERAGTVARKFVVVESQTNSTVSRYWKSATVTAGPRLLNQTGMTVAYCFTISNNGRYNGYLLVSGDTNMPPVLEWSLGPCPYLRYPEQCIRALDEYKSKSGAGRCNLNLLYATPGRTLSKANMQGGKAKSDVWMDLQAVTFQTSKFPALFDPISVYKTNSTYSSAWSLLSSAGNKTNTKVKERDIDGIPYFPFFRSSHVLAAGCALANLGAMNRNEITKAYFARLGNFIEHCLCDRPDKPVSSILSAGVSNFCRMRGLPINSREFVIRNSSKHAHLDFDGFKELVDSRKPVVLTYSADPSDAKDYEHLRLRLYTTSALAYGYREDSTGKYALAYFPSVISSDTDTKTLPSVCNKPGIIYVNWDAPTAGSLAIVFERGR